MDHSQRMGGIPDIAPRISEEEDHLKGENFYWNPAGNQSGPAEPCQQPEARLAWGEATLRSKRTHRDQTLCD
jgi:hypothetical protein